MAAFCVPSFRFVFINKDLKLLLLLLFFSFFFLLQFTLICEWTTNRWWQLSMCSVGLSTHWPDIICRHIFDGTSETVTRTPAAVPAGLGTTTSKRYSSWLTCWTFFLSFKKVMFPPLFCFLPADLYSLWVGKKVIAPAAKRSVCPAAHLLAVRRGSVVSRQKTPKRGTNEGGCECLQSGDYKAMKRR